MSGPTEAERRSIEARTTPQRRAEIEGLVQSLAPVIVDAIVRVVEPLKARIKALEENPLKYRGVWDRAKRYGPNSFVTDSGSVWHSAVESRGVKPGEDGNAVWTLSVKRGKNAR